jgi:hypothetical protein
VRASSAVCDDAMPLVGWVEPRSTAARPTVRAEATEGPLPEEGAGAPSYRCFPFGGGAFLGPTTTLIVCVPAAPSESVTFTVTVYVPRLV